MLVHFSPRQVPNHNGVIKMYNLKLEICPSGCSRVSARVNSPSSGLPTASAGQDRLRGSIPAPGVWWDMAPRPCPDTLLTSPTTPGKNKNEPAFPSLVASATPWSQNGTGHWRPQQQAPVLMDLTSLHPSLHRGSLETKQAGTCPMDIPPTKGSSTSPPPFHQGAQAWRSGSHKGFALPFKLQKEN